MAEASTAENPGTRPAEQQGGSADNSNASKEKFFTQEEVNSFLKKAKVDVREVREQLAAELETMRGELNGGKEKLASFEKFFEDLQQEPEKESTNPQEEFDNALRHPPTWVKTPRDREHYEKWCRREFLGQTQLSAVTQTLDEMKAELANEKKARGEAEAARLDIEKSRREADKKSALLTLSQDPQINAIDAEAFRRYFWDDVVYDQKTGRDMFRDEDGKLQPLRKALIEVMPDFLRKSATATGGSGSGGSRVANPEAELTQARAVMAQAEQRARISHRQADITEYQKAKKAVLNLEKQPQKAA